jgi:DNA invertase Pin-like site-specific DNA recombinase
MEPRSLPKSLPDPLCGWHRGDRRPTSRLIPKKDAPITYTQHLTISQILSVAAQKQINVYAVKGSWRLDQSIQSKILAMAFSMAAEIERDLISQRTKEALRFKRAKGMKLGRPTGPGKSKLDAYRPEIEGLLANGSTQKFIARRYHTTEANLHHWLRKHGLKRSP